ncbi:maleylpyruvate isomerase family mycothiol-dependent enzyme [Streptomyces sp. NPDC096057]|uniref:maleylpyruvate isomerase family mycothiol-dependent enzyme n=1 Tax=Streptomyces sp. NPDC096057 TaxID=3155543 RepID=UPI003320BE08
MADHALDHSLAWARNGSRLLTARLDDLGEASATGPSTLPGWSRGHVLTHLARNADALVNLLTWARTGVETPMYTDPATRLDDIERGAARPAREIVEDLRTADARLLAAVDALPAPAWQAAVRSALGRTVPASEVPWMRARELWIHLVDLDAGDDFDVLPDDLVDALLTEASATVGAKDDCPAVLLCPDDRDGPPSHRLGPQDLVPEEVGGPAHALCAWLLGRGTPTARKVTAGTSLRLPAWL